MTNEDINKYLDNLNSTQNVRGLVFTRKISDDVEVARVWDEEPKITDKVVSGDAVTRRRASSTARRQS